MDSLKDCFILVISITLILIIAVFFVDSSYKNREIIVSDYSETIDSLKYVIDTLNKKQTELKKQEDSVRIEFIEIQKEYETKYVDVVNQSVDSDIRFFTEYINNFSKNY